jgi:hypothetical protein
MPPIRAVATGVAVLRVELLRRLLPIIEAEARERRPTDSVDVVPGQMRLHMPKVCDLATRGPTKRPAQCDGGPISTFG